MCSCIARILKVCNVFDIIYSKKQVKICRFKIASPLGNQVCFPHYNRKIVMGVLNCLRTNAKRFIISSLLCEERVSGNESYQIEIKKTNCWEMGQKYGQFRGRWSRKCDCVTLGYLTRDGVVSVCILYPVCSLQSTVCILYLVCSLQSAVCILYWPTAQHPACWLPR